MKYKLKRDLPFVKTSPYPQDNEGLQIIELEDKFIVKFIDCNYYIWQTDIPKNNAHLYLEEVKPREFWIEIQTTGTFVQTCKDDLDNEGEVIKVREVIQ